MEKYKDMHWKDYIKSDNFKWILEHYQLKLADFTCDKCKRKDDCDLSYDPYSVHGDCLAEK